MNIIKIIGYILILWGIADFAFSWGGVDLWWSVFGIILPSPIYSFSHIGTIVIGVALSQVRSQDDRFNLTKILAPIIKIGVKSISSVSRYLTGILDFIQE